MSPYEGTPILSLTPGSPWASSFDPADVTAPWAEGSITTYGGFTQAKALGLELRDQYNNDWIVLGGDAVPINHPLRSTGNDPKLHCTLKFTIKMHNVAADKQLNIYFQMQSAWGKPTAQFFMWAENVLEEQVSVEGNEPHSIQFQLPGQDPEICVGLRVASSDPSDLLAIKGLDCTLY